MTAEEKKTELKRAVEEIAQKKGALIEDEKLRSMFMQCFQNTAATTVRFLDNGEAYVFTGDIEAMWLRDSSAQVVHYLPFLKEYPILKELVKGLIKRQLFYIRLDPYANAFNETANGRCWEKDDTEQNPWEWERKYEVDSLCYPVWLLWHYWKQTGDREIFGDAVKEALTLILKVWETEQQHEQKSPYRFERHSGPPSDTLTREGKGSRCACTGMTWSGFRPSDDACRYGYLIPANFFAACVLSYIEAFAEEVYADGHMKRRTSALRKQICLGIRDYGIVRHEKYGKIYAYETDGLGNYSLMDDANVPSLLSLPWLGEGGWDPEIYKNTRAFVLSEDNPYYYKGKAAEGIGSPHTPEGYIWHIALTMQGLTAENSEEKRRLLEALKNTDADTGFMHEGFHADTPGLYTREWFAWANSLFALFVLTLLKEGEKL